MPTLVTFGSLLIGAKFRRHPGVNFFRPADDRVWTKVNVRCDGVASWNAQHNRDTGGFDGIYMDDDFLVIPVE